MSKLNIKKELIIIMSELFNIDKKKIGTKTNMDNTKNWDSVAHMNLIMSIEEKFKIDLKDDDIVEMISFDLIFDTINNYIKNKK